GRRLIFTTRLLSVIRPHSPYLFAGRPGQHHHDTQRLDVYEGPHPSSEGGRLRRGCLDYFAHGQAGRERVGSSDDLIALLDRSPRIEDVESHLWRSRVPSEETGLGTDEDADLVAARLDGHDDGGVRGCLGHGPHDEPVHVDDGLSLDHPVVYALVDLEREVELVRAADDVSGRAPHLDLLEVEVVEGLEGLEPGQGISRL